MNYLMERIGKILDDLNSYIYGNCVNIDNIMVKEGKYNSIQEADRSSEPWKYFSTESHWGGRYSHAWFRMKITIPESFKGETTAVVISTLQQQASEAQVMAGYVAGREKRWDIMNPQFLVYIDGEIVQGLDVNHREIILEKTGSPGRILQVDIKAYGGMTDKKFGLYADLVSVDQEVKRLYYNVNVPLLTAKQLPPEDKRRIDMIGVLNSTMNLLDLRKPSSDKFRQSIQEANDFIEKELYQKICGHEEVTATCVGHTHIDVAWLWTLTQTREKVARSFSTVLTLMEEYPEYIFMSSQPQLYKFIKEDYPELYEKIRQKVREGRWEPEGAMWLEADCNLSSGESLVRQILFGTRYFASEFGVKNHVLWLPDVFGYSAALPQILKKSGIDYFMTSKISWNQFNKLPYDLFMWKGIDGTEILSYFLTTRPLDSREGTFHTTYNGNVHPTAIMGGWDRFQQKHLNDDILIAFGYGDGGGGPTREMLENAARMSRSLPGCPKVRMGKVADFFKRLEEKVSQNKYLPKWVGELYLENHQGTLTSMGRNKKYNRRSEQLFQDVECLSVMAMYEGKEYDGKGINAAWETILMNQFHDILPGSSIKEVYEVSREQYESVLSFGSNLLRKSMEYIVSKIDIPSLSLVVFNTLSYERSDIAVFDVPEGIKYPCIVDESGKVYECQILNNAKAMFFAEKVPAKGYKAYKIAHAQNIPESTMSATDSTLENDYFKLEFDSNGNIRSFFDKENKRQILKHGERANVFQAFEDKPRRWDAWNIDIYYQEKMWEINDIEDIRILETGCLRSGIRIVKRFMDSILCQDIYIYKNIPRVDFETFIDWKEDQILLKAAFPVDINASMATYEIQFGSVERPTHSNTSWEAAQYEMCAHKWADLSEKGYGVSLLNDCKYGHDIKDGIMRLTLVKSGIAPYKEADREKHYFTYSIYPHAGDWRDGKTVQTAYNLNVPLYTLLSGPHNGVMPGSASIVSVNSDNVIVETVKKAEDSDDIVVRMYECCNMRSFVKLTFYKELESVTECSLMEKDMYELPVEGGKFTFEIKPYEIKTFKLKLNFKT